MRKDQYYYLTSIVLVSAYLMSSGFAIASVNTSGSIALSTVVLKKSNQRKHKVIRHRIRPGDSITSISRKYGISRKQLIRNNRLRRPYRLRLGRRLYIKRIRVKPKRKRVVLRGTRYSRRSPNRKRKRGKIKQVTSIRIRTYRHRVRRGETIRSIARRSKVSMRQIIKLNRLRRPYRVRRGQILILKRVRTVTVQRTVSPSKTSRNRRMRTQRIDVKKTKRTRSNTKLSQAQHKKANSINKVNTKPKKPLQPMRIRTYFHRVQARDNLRRLSKRHKVSQRQIIRLNRLRYPYHLRPGRKLIIKKVWIRAGHDEFQLGDKAGWQEIKPDKSGSRLISANKNNSHKFNVKIKKPSTIGNKQAKVGKRRAFNNTAPHKSNRHIAASGTSPRSVINKRGIREGTGNGFMTGSRWMWPTKGKLESRYSRSSKGIKITGQLGQSIFSAAKGKIVYIGSSLIRYGNLIIIKHNDTFFTAYAHNRRLLVREGEYVQRGQKIAEMGSASSGKIVLHFEIRKDGHPVDPLRYLPEK